MKTEKTPEETIQQQEEYHLTPIIAPPTFLSGGKRTNIRRSEWIPEDWWTGFGKDESCHFEGPWYALVILAAKILREPATELVAPNLYRPDLKLTLEQENHYVGGGPNVTWPNKEDE